MIPSIIMECQEQGRLLCMHMLMNWRHKPIPLHDYYIESVEKGKWIIICFPVGQWPKGETVKQLEVQVQF